MKKFDLQLDFKSIRERIELDMRDIQSKKWAELLNVSASLISNIHGKGKNQNPPLPYIIAVARITGKPVESYLYGEAGSEKKNDEWFMCGWSPEAQDACRTVKEILDSGDEDNVLALKAILKILTKSIKNSCLQRDIEHLKSEIEHIKNQQDLKKYTGTG